ncbi:MAG: CHAP domain-containing protein [Acidimicrobiales bacterium]
MSGGASSAEPVDHLHQVGDDEQARRIEAELIAEGDNALQDGDPDDQPDQDAPPSFHPPTTALDRVIARFESQLGVTEQPPGSNRTIYTEWYGLTGPWCAMFVSWCFATEGSPLAASTSKGFAYTPSGAAWFKKQDRWATDPARGHVVFFDFPGDGVDRISHVGIVTAVHGDGSIETVEGNTDERGGRTGGKVMRRRRKVGIVGYGVPAYVDAGFAAEAAHDLPPTPPPVHFPEEAMTNHTMAIQLDANGNGYNDLVGVPVARVASVVVKGPNPEVQGRYARGFHDPEVTDANGNARVVIKATSPGKAMVEVSVWAVD